MKCSRCNREMDKATGWLGSLPYGPVCWRRMFPVEKKITAKVVKNDQPDLFEAYNVNTKPG